MYRSANANRMYDLIREYLAHGSESVREQITHLLVLTGEARLFLTEFTVGGYSLLLDCLNVGKKTIVTPTARENAKVLFQHFISHLTSPEKATLFKKANFGGFTILHSIILTGDETLVELYFKEIISLLASNALSPEDYCQILLMNEKNDINLLQMAITSKNKTILEIYANALRAAFFNGDLSARTFKKFMLSVNKSDQTAMLKAIATDNVDVFTSYLQLLEFCLENKILSKNDMSFLICKSDRAGFTPIIETIKKANVKIFSIYRELLIIILQNNLLPLDELQNLITVHNSADFSPLYQAILTKNPEILQSYLSLLTLTHAGKNIFSPDELETIIYYKSKGLNVLHQACTTSDFTIIEAIVNFIQQIFPQKAATIMTKLMQQKGDDGSILEGRTPEVDPAASNALSMNMYLTSFVNEIPFVYNKYLHIHALNHIDASNNPEKHRSIPLRAYPPKYIASSLDPSDQNRESRKRYSFYASAAGNDALDREEDISYHPYKRRS